MAFEQVNAMSVSASDPAGASFAAVQQEVSEAPSPIPLRRAVIAAASGFAVVMLWYLSNRTVYWIQDGYLAATGLGPFDEETLEFPSASAIGQIPVGLVLAGLLFAAVTAFRSGSRRGWCTVAAAVVLVMGGGIAVAAVTEQAGRHAHDCARGWQRTAVETATSWSIRCIDENFQPQGDVGHARGHQRYELGRDSRIYAVAR